MNILKEAWTQGNKQYVVHKEDRRKTRGTKGRDSKGKYSGKDRKQKEAFQNARRNIARSIINTRTTCGNKLKERWWCNEEKKLSKKGTWHEEIQRDREITGNRILLNTCGRTCSYWCNSITEVGTLNNTKLLGPLLTDVCNTGSFAPYCRWIIRVSSHNEYIVVMNLAVVPSTTTSDDSMVLMTSAAFKLSNPIPLQSERLCHSLSHPPYAQKYMLMCLLQEWSSWLRVSLATMRESVFT